MVNIFIQFWRNVLSPWTLNDYEKVYILTKNYLVIKPQPCDKIKVILNLELWLATTHLQTIKPTAARHLREIKRVLFANTVVYSLLRFYCYSPLAILSSSPGLMTGGSVSRWATGFLLNHGCQFFPKSSTVPDSALSLLTSFFLALPPLLNFLCAYVFHYSKIRLSFSLTRQHLAQT